MKSKTFRFTLLDDSYIDVEAFCVTEALELARKQKYFIWYWDVSILK